MADKSTDPRRAVQFLIWATLGLFLMVLALMAVAWVDAGNKRAYLRDISNRAAIEAKRARLESTQTHLALCALRSDLDRRADTGERQLRRSIHFLATHPEGIPHVPISLIRQGIADQKKQVDGQRSTIKVLSVYLTCRPIKGEK